MELKAAREELRKKILAASARLPRLVNMDPSSKHFGCGDRDFWTGKKKFPNARFQEIAYSLALLYTNPFEGNRFYKSAGALEMIDALTRYWASSQYRSGAFDEWYHHEQGMAPTAFSAYAFSRVFCILEKELSAEAKERIENAAAKAAKWLSWNEDGVAINHDIEALAAIAEASKAFGIRKFDGAIYAKKEKILQNQSPDGWFKEIDGFDLLYNSLSTENLSLLAGTEYGEGLINPLRRAVEFNSYFTYPDGLLGGGFTSRFCGGLWPYGYMRLAGKIQLAGRMAQRAVLSLAEGKMEFIPAKREVGGYFLAAALPNLLLAFFEDAPYEKKSTALLPAEREGGLKKVFKDSKIAVLKNANFYSVISLAKGGLIGAVYSYRKNRTVMLSSPVNWCANSGVRVVTDTAVYSTMKRGEVLKYSLSKDRAKVTSRLARLNTSVLDARWGAQPNSSIMAGKRWINHILNEHSPPALVQQIRDRFGTKLAAEDLAGNPILERTISFGDNEITVSNKLAGCGDADVFLEETVLDAECEDKAIKKARLKADCFAYDVAEGITLRKKIPASGGELRIRISP